MRIILFLFINLFLIACQSEGRITKPSNLIDKSKMVDVLVDTYISNAARNKVIQDLREQNIKLDKIIFEKYDIDSIQFVESNAYYAHDIEAYIDLLNKVEQEIIRRKELKFGERPPSKASKEKGEEEI